MRITDACPISGTPDVRVGPTAGFLEYDCPVCGRFRITVTAMELAGDEDQPVLFDALRVAKVAAGPDEVPMIENLSG